MAENKSGSNDDNDPIVPIDISSGSSSINQEDFIRLLNEQQAFQARLLLGKEEKELDFNIIQSLIDLIDHVTNKDDLLVLRIAISPDDYRDLKDIQDLFALPSTGPDVGFYYTTHSQPQTMSFMGRTIVEDYSLEPGKFRVYSEIHTDFTLKELEEDK